MSKEYAVRRRQKNNKKSPSMSYGQDKRKTKKIMAENMRLLRMSQARRRTRNDTLFHTIMRCLAYVDLRLRL